MENKPKLGYDSLLSSPHQIREKKNTSPLCPDNVLYFQPYSRQIVT
jgi:hypothetical protein